MMEGLQPYPEYKESVHPWIDKIPAHWEEKRGKYLFREVDERSKTGDEELLSVSHITGVTPRSQKNINMFLAESYIGSKLCHEGDLVINTMWAWMAALGVSKQTGIVSPSYGVYRPKSRDCFINEYIDHLLRTQSYADEYLCRSTGIRASRLRLYPESFLQIPILCPPLDEQELAVKFLRWKNYQIGQYIRGKRKEIELLNEQKQAIIHQAVTRGLDPSVPMKPSGIEWLGEIPKHWEIIPIKRVLKRLIDTEHKTAPAVDGGKYPVIRTSNIKDGKLVFDDIYYTDENGYFEWTRRGKPLPGELLFTREAPAGEVCIVPDEIDLCMGQRVVLLGVDSHKVYPEFLLLLLYSGVSKEYIKIKSVGSTVPHFNMSDIATIPILVPPTSEQLKIVKEIGFNTYNIDAVIKKTHNEILLIGEYRTRLITDVVTGKIDVRAIGYTLPNNLEEEQYEDLIDEDNIVDDDIEIIHDDE
ncbi:Type I restriction modification DNA specificity domain protein [anaerobic digester metagenome]